MEEKVDRAPQRDAVVAELAAAQHGIVTSAQLAESGFGPNAIALGVGRGRLHRVHRGVYAVGYLALSTKSRWLAAVLACGGGAVLSHGSAAALWGLLRPLSGDVDVSVPSYNGRGRRRGIRLHRCASLAEQPEEWPLTTVRDGIPVTSVPRTLEDLRGAVPPRLHRRAVRQAEIGGYALGPRVRGDRTRSDLERDFLAFCHAHDLPLPEVNAQIGPWKVDFLWRDARLAVETDSFEYHRGSVAFEDDHARDLGLRRRGLTVRRFTAAQIRDHPAAVVADLREVLSAPAGPASSASS